MSNLVLDNQLYDYQVTFTGGNNMMQQPQQSPWSQYGQEVKSKVLPQGLNFAKQFSNNLLRAPAIQGTLNQASSLAQSGLNEFGSLASMAARTNPLTSAVWDAASNTDLGNQARNLNVNRLVQQGTQALNNNLQNYQLAPQQPVPPMSFQPYQVQGGAKKSRKSKPNKEIEDIYGSCGCEGSKETKKKAKPKRTRSRTHGKKKAKK